MSDFSSFVNEQLAREGVAREYYRLAPFYRLADQLVLLRKKRGLTQQELAQAAQTTQAVVSRLENVSVRCSLETVVRLAEAWNAVVEVKLMPVEEQNPQKEPPAAAEPCAGEDDSDKGIVYFRQAAKKPCQNVLWSSFDPLSQTVYTPKERRKLKIAEIA
jgi:transcriptional regulator with XRE-family HTH domain